MINVNIDNIENEFLNPLNIDDFYNTNEYCNLFSENLKKYFSNTVLADIYVEIGIKFIILKINNLNFIIIISEY